MSGQAPSSAQRMRRNASPSQPMRPMKAVKAFGLTKGSPPRKSPSSPIPWEFRVGRRRSPVTENRLSPERRSPGSPSTIKVERPKAVRLSPATSSLRRTGSLETISTYLKGQWPTQPSGTFMLDKGTQTPDDWHDVKVQEEKKKKKGHRRSSSFGQGDQLTNQVIRQRLQKTKEHGSKHRQSPVPANHQALSMTAPAVMIRSAAIGIPPVHTPKSMSRYQRNSVEGLNPEIEKLVTMTISGPDDEDRPIEIPDGHRAPVPDVNRTSGTRSIDTQTPSGTLDELRELSSPVRNYSPAANRDIVNSSSPASRPQSISPTIPYIPGGHLDNASSNSRPCSNDTESLGSTPREAADNKLGDTDHSSSPDTKITASPQPNKIVREPPDGCEYVKAVEENRKTPSIKEPLLFCPIKPSQFILKPSSSSAFCPLSKLYTQELVHGASASAGGTCNSIEGQ